MIKLIYDNLKFDLDSSLKKSLLNAINEEFKKIEITENNRNEVNEEDGR